MCGIAGFTNQKKAAEALYFLLHFQQHRATYSAGITTSDGVNQFRHTGEGIVQDVFDEEILDRLIGKRGIAHIRYSTNLDDARKDNTQPVVEDGVAIAHNGNITNTKALRKEFGPDPRFATSMDTELLLKRWIRSKAKDPIGKAVDMLLGVEGSYSLLVMEKDIMLAIRDPKGVRPLWVGERNGGYIFASESVAFDNIGQVEKARELLPGEIFVVYPEGSTKSFFFDGNELFDSLQALKKAHCVFEPIYYSHPATTVFGIQVAKFRRIVGEIFAKTSPSPAKQVVAVPDSAIFFAVGYAMAKIYAYVEQGITRSHYIGRSFIENEQVLRVNKVARKFTIIRFLLDRAITLIDDSIVRGTTFTLLVKMLKDRGITEVHGRIACPPIIGSCHYGIDTPTREELKANNHTVEEMRQEFGLKSLEFLTLEDLKKALREVGQNPDDFCFACLTRKYPIPVPDANIVAA